MDPYEIFYVLALCEDTCILHHCLMELKRMHFCRLLGIKLNYLRCPVLNCKNQSQTRNYGPQIKIVERMHSTMPALTKRNTPTN